MENENRDYWNKRAEGYSEVNIEELNGIQRITWAKLLTETIDGIYHGSNRKQIKILDIGAGPGFLSIVMSEQGYTVNSADFSEEMLLKAKANAESFGIELAVFKENAQELTFDDSTYDVIVSRNLTWNLPNPKAAYSQWLRVLKPGGLLLIFDANWYSYLCDENSRAAYEQDRLNVEADGLEDYNIGENFDKMEAIAMRLPLTGIMRPKWDEAVFQELGVSEIEITENIGDILYSEKEKVNYKSTPLFMIKVIK